MSSLKTFVCLRGTLLAACGFVSLTALTTTACADTIYPAEDSTFRGGITLDTNHPGFHGTGFLNFSRNHGVATFNHVDGNGGGTKQLSIRYALGSTGPRTGLLRVNGANQAIKFTPTSSWDQWQVTSANIILKNDLTNTIELISTGADLANIDEISVLGAT